MNHDEPTEENSRHSAPPSAATAPSPGPLRILHLEDNRLDAEIVHHLLGSEFPGSDIRLVENRDAFLREMRSRSYDLIISDFSFDSFDGFEALELTRQHAPHLPFVFYSGTLGEERAVQAMQFGARDYVPKGQLQRLATAIRRTFARPAEGQRVGELERHNQAQENSLNEALALNRKLGEQAKRAHRLENVSLLAADAAHDLNNVLAPMLMATPMLREASTDVERRRLIDMLERSIQRCASLVAQVATVTRDDEDDAQPIQLEAPLRETAQQVTATFPRNLQIEESVPAALWPVRALPAQLVRMLLNLCLNARDAMPSGGTLTLAAENCRVDAMSARLIPGARAGAFVMLRIDDTGCGISSDVLRTLWDPAMRPKGNAGETTLGLPTVRAIVKRHGGFVQVQTAVGLGSSFRIFLPALLPKPEQGG